MPDNECEFKSCGKTDCWVCDHNSGYRDDDQEIMKDLA